MAKPKKKPDTATVKAEPEPPAYVQRGRPTLFTPEIVAEIVYRMENNGETINKICADEHMPARTTVMGWKKDNEAFKELYAEAHKSLLEYQADAILDIADDATNDWMERENSKGDKTIVFNKEAVSRSALRIEARKWLLAKLMQDRFGDKSKTEHTGKVVVEWAVAPAAKAPPP